MAETRDEAYRRAKEQIAAQVVQHQREGGAAVPNTKAAEREAQRMIEAHHNRRRDASVFANGRRKRET